MQVSLLLCRRSTLVYRTGLGSISYKDSGGNIFTIGKLAALTDVSTDALRYYEREGLIEPMGKSRNGYRYYVDDSTARIRFIKHAQTFGFTLAEIREMIVLRAQEGACSGDMRKLIERKRQVFEHKLQSMQLMVDGLDQLLAGAGYPNVPVARCLIFAALEEGKTKE